VFCDCDWRTYARKWKESKHRSSRGTTRLETFSR
jgi:hypothetical protein